MVKNSHNVQDKLIYLLAAVLPVFFMLIAYIKMGFFPFGDKTLYTWDLQGQYSSFMVLMHNLLTGQEHIGYSLTGGLGGSLYGLAAYYLGSPFNIIMIFFDERTMPIGIMVLILIKTAFMGLFMFIYLCRKKKSVVAVLFSTAYAFSAYVIAYQSNIMWLDALVFLPLVILGLEKLIRERKCLLYIISLGLTIISNYFTAYMVCLFVIFYFIGFMVLIEWKESDFRKKVLTTCRFICSSLLGGGLSAFLLVPMLYDMQVGMSRQNVKWEAVKNGARFFYYRSILPFFLSCSYDNSQRQDSMGTFPLLYCGAIAVFGMALFFIMRNISWRQKIAGIFFLTVLLVSSNHMNLFFIWHGFYTPFGAPWRFIFLWSFVVLSVACEGITAFIRNKNRLCDFIVLAGMCLYFIWVFWRFESYRQITIFNACVVLFETVGFFIWKYGKRYERIISLAICILALGTELICNALFTWNQGFEFESYDEYQRYIGEAEKLLLREDGIYRSVIAEEIERSLNDGFLWNINTIDCYSSATKKKMWETGNFLNLGDFRDMGFYNKEAPLLTKDIVSLKYIYGGDIADIGYEKIKTTTDGISVFENKNILPFGFLVDKSAPEITSGDWERDICEKQNALFHALAGSRGMEAKDIYERISGGEKMCDPEGKETADSYIENTELIQEAVEKTAVCTLGVTADKESDITVKIRNDMGETGYVCFSVPYERGWRAVVDGVEATAVEGMGGLLLVPVEAGGHEVRIVYTASGSVLGAVISLISLVGVIIYAFCIWKRNITIGRDVIEK